MSKQLQLCTLSLVLASRLFGGVCFCQKEIRIPILLESVTVRDCQNLTSTLIDISKRSTECPLAMNKWIYVTVLASNNKPMKLLLDTGSPITWLASMRQNEEVYVGDEERAMFQKRTFSLRYGSQEHSTTGHVKYFLEPQVKIMGVKNKNAIANNLILGLVENGDDLLSNYADTIGDGILGMGLRNEQFRVQPGGLDPNEDQFQNFRNKTSLSFLDQLKLGHSSFTIDLCQNQSGLLTFGAYRKTSDKTVVINYLSSDLQNHTYLEWKILVDKIELQFSDRDDVVSYYQKQDNNSHDLKLFNLLFDTGNKALFIPYYRSLGDAWHHRIIKYDHDFSTLSYKYGSKSLNFPCDKLKDISPTITFTFKSGFPYRKSAKITFNPEDYIEQMNSPKYQLPCNSRLYLTTNEPQMVLGIPFFEKYKTSFEWGDSRILFPKPNNPRRMVVKIDECPH